MADMIQFFALGLFESTQEENLRGVFYIQELKFLRVLGLVLRPCFTSKLN